jgi:hypothetical protein
VRVPLVLIHSPLVTADSWAAVAAVLRGGGHDVLLPDLSSSLAASPLFWPRQVEAIVDAAGEREAVLVAHSAAGPLLSAVGERVGRIAGCVFVDARLPHPGQSWFDSVPPQLADQLQGMAVAGWLPPWSEWWGPDGLAELLPDEDLRARFAAGCPRLPLAMFEEVHPPAPHWPTAPCAYLRLSEAYEDEAARAAGLGWPVIRLASHHLALLTDPAVVAEAISQLLRAIH